MIKRYNQFVKGKINEDYEMNPPVEAPQKSMPSLGRPSAPVVPNEIKDDFTGEEEEIAVDKYEMALQTLADAAGVDFTTGQKSVEINGKEVTFPAETEKYHIKGVKKPFVTAEEVIGYLEGGSVEGGSTHIPQLPKNEVSDEMTSIKDEEVIDSGEQFESKSYKSKRRIKK